MKGSGVLCCLADVVGSGLVSNDRCHQLLLSEDHHCYVPTWNRRQYEYPTLSAPWLRLQRGVFRWGRTKTL